VGVGVVKMRKNPLFAPDDTPNPADHVVLVSTLAWDESCHVLLRGSGSIATCVLGQEC